MIKLEVTRICAHHLFKISTRLQHDTKMRTKTYEYTQHNEIFLGSI